MRSLPALLCVAVLAFPSWSRAEEKSSSPSGDACLTTAEKPDIMRAEKLLKPYVGLWWFERRTEWLRANLRGGGEDYSYFAKNFSLRRKIEQHIKRREIGRAVGIYKGSAIPLFEAYFNLRDLRQRIPTLPEGEEREAAVKELAANHRNLGWAFFEYDRLTADLGNLAAYGVVSKPRKGKGAAPAGESNEADNDKTERKKSYAQDVLDQAWDAFKGRNPSLKSEPRPTVEQLEQAFADSTFLSQNEAAFAFAKAIYASERNASTMVALRRAFLLGEEQNFVRVLFKRAGQAWGDTNWRVPNANVIENVFGGISEGLMRFARGAQIFAEYYEQIDRAFPSVKKGGQLPRADDLYNRIRNRYIELQSEGSKGERYAYGFLVAALRRSFGDIERPDWYRKWDTLKNDMKTHCETNEPDALFKKAFLAAFEKAKKQGTLPQIAPDSTIPYVQASAQVLGYAIYFGLYKAVSLAAHLGFFLTDHPQPVWTEEREFIINFGAAVFLLRQDAQRGDPEAQALWARYGGPDDDLSDGPQDMVELRDHIGEAMYRTVFGEQE